MSEAALFYPRMHIYDVDWLKGALLLFDEVKRMVPPDLPIDDSVEVLPFTRPHGKCRILLNSARIASPRARQALSKLTEKTEEDARSRDFRRRFGEEQTRAALLPDDYGYQIHIGKFGYWLVHTLREKKLCWRPHRAEPHDYWEGYIEVNHRLGEAIMSTLAIACAKAEGLKIITDSDSLHDCLIRQDGERVYEAWVRGEDKLAEPRVTSGRELMECLVTIACDTSKLGPQSLAKMKEDREPLRRLLAKLDERAKTIAPMDEGKARNDRLRSEVSDILAAWERDRANMSPFFKRFFGLGLLDPSAKFAEKVVTSLSSVAATVGAGVTAGTMLGAEYGLGIGLVAHTVKSYADTSAGRRNSPYALLTTVERQGVVFRSSADFTRPEQVDHSAGADDDYDNDFALE